MMMISDLGPKHSKPKVVLFQIGPLGKKSVEVYNRVMIYKWIKNSIFIGL